MSESQPNQTINQPTPPPEKIPHVDKVSHKSIYEASAFEIFWRNLLAGMSRAFGGIILYLLFLFFIAALIQQVLYPKIKPFIDQYQQTLESLNNLNQTSQNIFGNNQNTPPTQPVQPSFDANQILNQIDFQKLLNQTTPTATPMPSGSNGDIPVGR